MKREKQNVEHKPFTLRGNINIFTYLLIFSKSNVGAINQTINKNHYLKVREKGQNGNETSVNHATISQIQKTYNFKTL